MKSIENETLYFRSCRNLSGKSRDLSFCKRNGRPEPIFPPNWSEQEQESDNQELQELIEEICYGLSPIERSTWLLLIDGLSLSEIARNDCVSRQAIYARIRGTKKSPGGMIAKNEYVAIWWKLHNKKPNDPLY